MKQTVHESDFIDAFQSIRPDNFSIPGLRALFDWFEGYEDSTGEEIELDVIAICCDFAEYSTALEAAEEHGYDDEKDEDAALDWLQDNTTVIPFNGGIIVQSS